MGKKLDWDAVASVNFDDKRRKTLGILTGKEAFAKAYDNLRKSQEALARRKEVEPILRDLLLKHMVGRLPIKVMAPIHNPTESLNGLQKSEEDDGFYNSTPSARENATASAKFEEIMEVIPAGIELVYKGIDKQLGQFLFKGSNGREYAVYQQNGIIFKGQSMENPGLYGLLFQTDLVSYLDEQS